MKSTGFQSIIPDSGAAATEPGSRTKGSKGRRLVGGAALIQNEFSS
ncbi:hypothetical protein [Blastomonas sp. UPD001]|jgi:hypothetical protein|nr:hypothetical protein [Blastomonas sp. UPD001]